MPETVAYSACSVKCIIVAASHEAGNINGLRCGFVSLAVVRQAAPFARRRFGGAGRQAKSKLYIIIMYNYSYAVRHDPFRAIRSLQ